MKNVFLAEGDVTNRTPVDAIVALVNSYELWFSAVDRAIYRTIGHQCHIVLTQFDKLKDGSAIVVKVPEDDFGIVRVFHNVLFVIDDLKLPLSVLVYNALRRAEVAKYTRIGLPPMRTRTKAGKVEQDAQEAIERMRKGIERFHKDFPKSNMEIVIVVYEHPEILEYFTSWTTPLED